MVKVEPPPEKVSAKYREVFDAQAEKIRASGKTFQVDKYCSGSQALARLTGADPDEVCFVTKHVAMWRITMELEGLPRGLWTDVLASMYAWGRRIRFDQMPSTAGFLAPFVAASEAYFAAGQAFEKAHQGAMASMDRLADAANDGSGLCAIALRRRVYQDFKKEAGHLGSYAKKLATEYPIGRDRIPPNSARIARHLKIDAVDLAHFEVVIGKNRLRNIVKELTCTPDAEQLAAEMIK